MELRLGPFRHPIQEVETEGLDGTFSADEGILLHPKITGSRRAVVMVHEGLHAVFDAAGYNLPEAEEEDLVNRLAPWVTLLVQQNPEFWYEVLRLLR